jgi:hypothetical protein
MAMPKPVPLIRKKPMIKALRVWMPFQPPTNRSIHLFVCKANNKRAAADRIYCQSQTNAEPFSLNKLSDLSSQWTGLRCTHLGGGRRLAACLALVLCSQLYAAAGKANATSGLVMAPMIALIVP